MIRTDSRHCQIVNKTLSGSRPTDQQSIKSMEILNQKLELLKKLDKSFCKVELSPHAKQLLKNNSVLAAC